MEDWGAGVLFAKSGLGANRPSQENSWFLGNSEMPKKSYVVVDGWSEFRDLDKDSIQRDTMVVVWKNLIGQEEIL